MNEPLLAGVVGWPIGHSRSPKLHGHWLRRHSIAGHYVPIALPPEKLDAGLRALALLGFRGVNVTIPHKERALALADRATTRARAIGAANTLVFEDGRVVADNTDGYGFLANLKAGAPDWQAGAGPALVLGAGGAARAVVATLIAEGVPEVRIVNRSRDRAEALASHFGASAKAVEWGREAAEGASTIVNATSLGMIGQPSLDFDLSRAAAAAVVSDLVYQPLETRFLQAARARGLVAVDGLGMLLHQAVPGFACWFGVTPEVDAALREAVLA